MKRMNRLFQGLSFFALTFLVPAMAYAVPTVGQIGTFQQGTAQGLGQGAYYFILFLGLVLAAVGIIMWVSAHKRHESPMPGIAMLVGGILLASITAIIDSGSATVFTGSNQSQVSTLLGGSGG